MYYIFNKLYNNEKKKSIYLWELYMNQNFQKSEIRKSFGYKFG